MSVIDNGTAILDWNHTGNFGDRDWVSLQLLLLEAVSKLFCSPAGEQGGLDNLAPTTTEGLYKKGVVTKEGLYRTVTITLRL